MPMPVSAARRPAPVLSVHGRVWVDTGLLPHMGPRTLYRARFTPLAHPLVLPFPGVPVLTR